MADILEHWLMNTLGYIVNLNSPNVGDLLYDGSVFHNILCTYNIVDNNKYPTPPKEPTKDVAFHSLSCLGLWFKILGVPHSKELLEKVAEKDQMACTRILYELYAKLETKDDTHFMMKQTAIETQLTPTSKFTVKKTSEPPKPASKLPPYFYLEKLLRDHKDVVEVYKDVKQKAREWHITEAARRREVMKQTFDKKYRWDFQQETNTFDDVTPEDPIDVFNRTCPTYRRKQENPNITNAEYVKRLREQRRSALIREPAKEKMIETLLNNISSEMSKDWDRMMTEVYKNILIEPCKHEKNLITTLEKIHGNYKHFSDFNNYVNQLADEENLLAETIHTIDKPRKKEYAKKKEMDRVLELHKRLWDETLRTKRKEHLYFCGKTVNDVINHAIKTSEFKTTFHSDPSDKLLDEWKELFFKELPVLREPHSFIGKFVERDLRQLKEGQAEGGLEEESEMSYPMIQEEASQSETPPLSLEPVGYMWDILKDSDIVAKCAIDDTRQTELELSMIYAPQSEIIVETPNPQQVVDESLCDRDIMDCLNNYNLRTYLNKVGPWDLKQWPAIWPAQSFDENMNVLGFVVHRLLDLKYNMPQGPKHQILPKFRIKILMGKFSDSKIEYYLNCLRELLQKSNVQVIDFSTIINYCMNIYKEEVGITEFGSVVKNLKSALELGVKEEIRERPLYKKWERRLLKIPEKPPKHQNDQTEVTSGRSISSRKSLAQKRQSRKSVARKSVARKSVARKSVARKSMARKSMSRKSVGGRRQSTRGSKKKDSQNTNDSSSPPLKVRRFNKATQIPSVPDLTKPRRHTAAGKLGKVAFETLAEGKKLNNAVLGNMLIEYLKTLDNNSGFVLVDFPTSALQANVFEHQLNGLPLQYQQRLDSEVNLFQTDDGIDVFSHFRCFQNYEKLLNDYIKEEKLIEEPSFEFIPEKKPELKSSLRSSSMKSRRSSQRKSMKARKSSQRKSMKARQSKTGRKSVAKQSVQHKKPKESVVKSTETNETLTEKHEENLPTPLSKPTIEEPPKPQFTLEQLAKLRISEILPRPNFEDLQFCTTSYFTSYINPLQVQSEKRDQLEQLRPKSGPFDRNPAELLMKDENKVHQMYKKLGLVTDFDYMTLDADTIKRLARVILGTPWDEDDITRKPSIELFGGGVLEATEKKNRKSDSSGSSERSRASFFDPKNHSKSHKFEGSPKIIHQKYVPIKPRKPTPEKKDEGNINLEEDSDNAKLKRKKGSRNSSRKSIKSKSPRKSMKSKSIARKSMKSKSISRKSMKSKSIARKSMKSKSIARKSIKGPPRKSIKSKGKSVDHQVQDETEIKPQPGEANWAYVRAPIPYEIGYDAATLWECVENVYVEDMENIFYLLRVHDMSLLSYKEYVRTSLENAMVREHEKQHLVTNFQLMLNKIEDDCRHDLYMKHELYVRVMELYDIMAKGATDRHEKSLAKKTEIINQGWVANYSYTIANLYLSMIQAEMNMFVESLQVLGDYYIGILGDVPSSNRPNGVNLIKNKMTIDETATSSRTSLTGGKQRRRSSAKMSALQLRQSLVIPSQIQRIFQDRRQASVQESFEQPDSNPTHALLSQVDSLKSKISSLRSACHGIISDPQLGSQIREKGIQLPDERTPKTGQSENKQISPPDASRRKSQRKSPRKSMAKRQSTRKSMAKRKSTRPSSAGRNQKKPSTKKSKTSGSMNEGADFVDALKQEWGAAVDHQTIRAEFRIKLIEARAKKDLDNVLKSMKTFFDNYQDEVDAQHTKELSAIDECIYVFKHAIEEGIPMQPMMVLDDTRFYVDRKVHLYPDPPPPPPVPLEESTRSPYIFTIEQIDKLLKKFSRMAPMGVIETSIIEVLGNMALAGYNTHKTAMPTAWAKLDPYDLKNIINAAYADQTCIDWRQFVINISDLPYPTIEQLQELKYQYKTKDLSENCVVTLKDYESIPLWFDDEFGETIEIDLKLSLAKTLIFKMFQVNDQELNYYDMLLGFCKAEDPEDGFGMALDLLKDCGFILVPDKCHRPDEFDYINPRKIVDFVLVNFIEDLLNQIENIELEFLPKFDNIEVYATEENAFQISEDILKDNMGKRFEYHDLSSTDSESNMPKPPRKLYINDDDELPAKYACEKWHMCIPYEITLALLLNALNYYALSEVHQHRFLNIGARLKALYNEKGTGNYLKAYRITRSDLFNDLFEKTNIFKKVNITAIVEEIETKKQENNEAINSSLMGDTVG